jgi:dihydroorotate dehydrogenase electron transfer subunit
VSTPPAAGYSARLLIATDDGIQPIIHAALELRAADPAAVLLVLIGADAAFPFKPRPSTILVPGMPPGVIACVPQLDEFGVASRLASSLGLPGCYDGSVLELVEQWLQAIEPSLRAQVHITVSGNEELVSSTEELGRRINVPVGTLENQSCDGGRHP